MTGERYGTRYYGAKCQCLRERVYPGEMPPNRMPRGTGELGYDGPLYDGFWHMTDDMLGPSQMHIKYSSYVYDRCCI